MTKSQLFLLTFSICVLSAVIYFKPVPGRYIFKEVSSAEESGYRIFDTSSGKWYAWLERSSDLKNAVRMIDPIHNKKKNDAKRPWVEHKFYGDGGYLGAD